MRKASLFILTAVAVTAVGAVCVLYARGTANAQDAAPKFQTAAVERGSLAVDVSCTGSVVSNLDVEIKCKASGEIVDLPFDVSDTVEMDDLLVALDPVDEERNVRQAQVRLDASQARLAQAKESLSIAQRDLENDRQRVRAELASARITAGEKRDKAARMAELLQSEYASPEEVETAQATAAQAQAALEKTRVEVAALAVQEQRLELLRQDIALAESEVADDEIALESARQRFDETRVYAPISGVVSERLVQAGQIISSPTSNVSGGTALLILSDLSRMFVLANVDESDIGTVRVGQPAVVSVDAFPDRKLHGEVVRVATKGASISNVVTFEVKIEVLDEARGLLRPEMTADVDIRVIEEDDVLLVPAAAVHGRGPRKMLLVPGDGEAQPQRIPVETGIADGARVAIRKGVQEGQTVLVPQQQEDSQWMRRDRAEDRPRGGPGGGPGMGGMMGGFRRR